MVRMSDTAYSVEAFQLVRPVDGPIVLRLEGWFVSAAPVQAMSLVIPGTPGHNITVTDMRRPSGGLVGLYGEQAQNARFKHEARIDSVPDNLTDARLMVLLGNGDVAMVAIGQQLSETDHLPVPAFTDQDRALVARFESLGDNCEFGLLQREVGVERLGLLRLAGGRDPSALADAIACGFDGFATGDDLIMSTHGNEWIARSRRYRFTFHTGVDVADATEAEILTEQSRTLRFMAEKLDEDIKTGTKFFVRRVNEDDVTEGMSAIYAALASRGELADYATANIVYPDPWLELLRAAAAVMAPPAEAPPAIGRAPSWPLTPDRQPAPPAPPAQKGWLSRLLKL
jgi:hypothetical protein